MKIENYYLDLEKVFSLKSESDRNKVHQYYFDIFELLNTNKKEAANSIFHTLYESGFLKEIRDKKINKILSENDTINN